MDIPSKNRERIMQIVNDDRKSAEHIAKNDDPFTRALATVFIRIADGKI
jgi:hypothetical protein